MDPCIICPQSRAFELTACYFCSLTVARPSSSSSRPSTAHSSRDGRQTPMRATPSSDGSRWAFETKAIICSNYWMRFSYLISWIINIKEWVYFLFFTSQSWRLWLLIVVVLTVIEAPNFATDEIPITNVMVTSSFHFCFCSSPFISFWVVVYKL